MTTKKTEKTARTVKVAGKETAAHNVELSANTVKKIDKVVNLFDSRADLVDKAIAHYLKANKAQILKSLSDLF